MRRHFQHYLKVKNAISNWVHGTGDISPIADSLNITSLSLFELFDWNGFIGLSGRTNDGIDTQDVLNLLFLTYSEASRTIAKTKKSKAK